MAFPRVPLQACLGYKPNLMVQTIFRWTFVKSAMLVFVPISLSCSFESFRRPGAGVVATPE